MVSFELLCRATEGVSLIGQAAILKELPATALVQNNPHRFEARVGAQGKATSMALVPDGVFALEYQAAGGQERENFFLEVDRGTMPVERRNLRGSSIYKKLLINHAGWREGRHTKQYGWQHFRVLTVTNSQERVGHMVSVAKRLNNGRGSRLFLFADDTCLSADTLPQKEWLDGRGETVTLNAE